MKKILGILIGLLLSASLSFAGGMSSPTTTPAGANTQLQFNNNGVFGADSDMAFVTDTLTTTKLNVPLTGGYYLNGVSIYKTPNVTSTYLGQYSGASAQAGAIYNTAAGDTSAYDISTGDYNVCIAPNSCRGVDTGSYNIDIGYGVGFGPGNRSYRFLLDSTVDATPFLYGELDNERLGIETATPTARFHLPAGMAPAGYAPQKETEGVLLTTAEAGAKEYEGNFFLTKKNNVRFGLGGTLKVSTTEVGNNAGGADTDVFSHTILAGTLHGQGGEIEFRVAGTFAATASTDKRVKVVWGATTIFDSGALAITTANSWSVYCRIMRDTAATAQKCICDFTTSSAVLPTTVSYNAASENLATNVTLKLALSGTNANDVVGEFYKTMFYTYEKP